MKRVVTIVTLAAVCILAMASTAGATGVGLRGIGGHLTIVSPEDIDATLGFGILADFGTVGTTKIGIESFMGYWSQSEEAYGAEMSVSDLIIGGRGKYMFEVSNPVVHPYLGAGLAFHFVSMGIDIAPVDLGGFVVPGTSVEDDEFKVGLDFGGGLTVDVSEKVSLLGDSWISMVSDVSQFALRLGMVYRLQSSP
jgi:hypothetical protein